MKVLVNEEAAERLMEDNIALKHRINSLKKALENKELKIESLEAKIEDLEGDVKHWKEEYDDLERDLYDNYVPRFKDKYEEYGVSEKDFY